MSHADGSLTLIQRKLVQNEIAREYRVWRKKLRREPTEDERRQIIKIGFEIARRRNKRIPAAPGGDPVLGAGLGHFEPGIRHAKSNPLVDSLIAGATGAIVGKVFQSNPLDNDEVNRLLAHMVSDLRAAAFELDRGHNANAADWLGRVWKTYVFLAGLGKLTDEQAKKRDELMEKFKTLRSHVDYSSNPLVELGPLKALGPAAAVPMVNPGHTTTKCCAVCGACYPFSWPWMSWEGRDICSSACFEGVQANPTGIAFSGERYYRPARRVGGRIVRRRYRVTPDMEPIAREHQQERASHPVRNNPLLMTVMGANPEPTDPGERYYAAPEAHEAELSEMGQLSRFRGLRHAGTSPSFQPCYAGTMTPGEPERITRLRQIASLGGTRCAACVASGREGGCPECRRITMFEGAPLDPLSASVIVQVYDALKPNQRAKFAKLPLSMMDKMIGGWFASKVNAAIIVNFILRATGDTLSLPEYRERFMTGVHKNPRLKSIGAVMANPRLMAQANPAPNPGRRRKVTMSLEKFAAMVKAKNDPKMWANFVAKVKGYQKWTHGSMPKKVMLETVDVPGVQGMWITYDMGREPEKLYVMPRGAKRKGAWRHPWERMPHLKGDPQAGIMLTKTVSGNKITDFLHG